jgi:hypothetical protein
MRRAIIAPTNVGSLLLAAAAAFSIFNEGFICYDSCPPESELASALAHRLASTAPLLLPGALLIAGAWGLCLFALARVRRWMPLAFLILALPVSVALALGEVLRATGGKFFPTTWYSHNANWSPALSVAALLLFIWPGAILLASLAVPRRSTA